MLYSITADSNTINLFLLESNSTWTPKGRVIMGSVCPISTLYKIGKLWSLVLYKIISFKFLICFSVYPKPLPKTIPLTWLNTPKFLKSPNAESTLAKLSPFL